MQDRRIRFVDFVCNEIAAGNFTSASTACNYLIYGTVFRSISFDDKNEFKLEIRPGLLWGKEFTLSRIQYLGEKNFRHTRLTLSETDKLKLFEAWQMAAKIQTKRNEQYDEQANNEREAAHWWP